MREGKVDERNWLRQALYEGPAWDLLEKYNCGWLDGGCGILRDALLMVFPKARAVSIQKGGRDEHLLVSVGDLFLDGEGVTTRAKLERIWAKELQTRMFAIEIFQARPAPTSEVIPIDEGLSIAVAELVREAYQGAKSRGLTDELDKNLATVEPTAGRAL